MRVPTFQHDGLQDLIYNVLTFNLNMVEIGCYAGESTKMFLDSGKVQTLVAIDPFIENNQDVLFSMTDVYHSFKEEVLEKYTNVIFYRDFSYNVIPKLTGKYDFIYIDGEHSYEAVKQDIILSLPKIKERGIIAGHDYCSEWQSVINAVHETLGMPDKIFQDNSWVKFL